MAEDTKNINIEEEEDIITLEFDDDSAVDTSLLLRKMAQTTYTSTATSRSAKTSLSFSTSRAKRNSTLQLLSLTPLWPRKKNKNLFSTS